jgi:hypothetical protein
VKSSSAHDVIGDRSLKNEKTKKTNKATYVCTKMKNEVNEVEYNGRVRYCLLPSGYVAIVKVEDNSESLRK